MQRISIAFAVSIQQWYWQLRRWHRLPNRQTVSVPTTTTIDRKRYRIETMIQLEAKIITKTISLDKWLNAWVPLSASNVCVCLIGIIKADTILHQRAPDIYRWMDRYRPDQQTKRTRDGWMDVNCVHCTKRLCEYHDGMSERHRNGTQSNCFYL